ncbi:guanylate kinase [Streptomyces sp. NPDC056400]|uniref:guanylate kinase n=1 Tax=unclassified Streptomyces TaxID=2593676 RepID=UPI0022503FE1|nr:guanylate kinase [Streptomyces sp. NBC_01214]MCX4801466.1 guanylate kinase [Streptomyces sp. NBC_01214]
MNVNTKANAQGEGSLGGVVLFGPPTAGKDTVSAALTGLDARYGQLTKIKVGSGRTTGYRMADGEELAALRAAGRVVLETRRYGNTYAIDRDDLDTMTRAGRIPLVHIGSMGHLRSFTGAVRQPWLCVLLWVPRDVCEQRSRGRGDRDTGDRLAAWDEALADLGTVPDGEEPFDLLMRTDHTDPAGAAESIARAHAHHRGERHRAAGLAAFLGEAATVER